MNLNAVKLYEAICNMWVHVACIHSSIDSALTSVVVNASCVGVSIPTVGFTKSKKNQGI